MKIEDMPDYDILDRQAMASIVSMRSVRTSRTRISTAFRPLAMYSGMYRGRYRRQAVGYRYFCSALRAISSNSI
jgi:hypothetical protein